MRIKELFNKGTVFSFEVFPPKKTSSIETVYRTLEELKGLKPDFISVTFGAGGSANSALSIEVARKIKEDHGIETAVHLPCINYTMDEITSILSRAKEAMTADTRLFIMETLWDRQRFDTAAFCLTMTSLYFTAIANGNSKMYNMEDMLQCVNDAGLRLENVYDGLGQGHSILVTRKV